MFVFASHTSGVWKHPASRQVLSGRRFIVAAATLAFALILIFMAETGAQRVAIIVSEATVILIDWSLFRDFHPFWEYEPVGSTELSQATEEIDDRVERGSGVTIRLRLTGHHAVQLEDLRHRLRETDYARVVSRAVAQFSADIDDTP